jgi:hypothetical protein
VSFTANNFQPLPNSSDSVIAATLPNADLANLVGTGQFDLDIVSQMTESGFVGVNNPNMTYTVDGTVMVCPIAVPEPAAWIFAVSITGVLVYLRARMRQAPGGF